MKFFASCARSNKCLIGQSISYTLANLQPFSPHQRTALHVAAEEGHTDTVKCLVGRQADINVKHTCSGVSTYIYEALSL